MVNEENKHHCTCLPWFASTQGSCTRVRNELLGMHTSDSTGPPSFCLVLGYTDGLLTMLGTSGVGDVSQKRLIQLC